METVSCVEPGCTGGIAEVDAGRTPGPVPKDAPGGAGSIMGGGVSPPAPRIPAQGARPRPCRPSCAGARRLSAPVSAGQSC
eukprot:12798721-Heterocapsa_arctica.AAC.1